MANDNPDTITILRTREEFESLSIGRLVSVLGEVGVHAGLESVQTCGCNCNSNIFQLPIIIHYDEGKIERREMYEFSIPQAGEIGVTYGSEIVKPDDPKHRAYEILLRRRKNLLAEVI